MAKTAEKTAGEEKKVAKKASTSSKKEKSLVIVESPAKTKTIRKILGDSFQIEASFGHVRNLPLKDKETQNLGFDVNNGFVPKYEVIQGKQAVVKKLNDVANKVDRVYLASDPDREGEAIAWHVREILKVPDEKIYRIVFNEITPKAVKYSVDNPRTIDMDMVQAQQTRQILDKLVGFKLSPVLWKQIGNRNLSAGRVQSVALRMICEREEEIEAFVPQEYWSIHAKLDKESKIFDAELSKIKGKTVEKNIKTQEEAQKIGKVDFLVQGTIYPDVVESGLGGESAVIKSHHNVGGLPDCVDFKEIIEPLRDLFKDEVRKVGLELDIPEYLVFRQPFPGPGLGIRIIGEVTEEKVKMVQDADFIYREEIAKAGIDRSIGQYFAALTNMRSVGVMGDERTYDYAVALRAVNTIDFMTAESAEIPYEILNKVMSRIINEVRGVNRVMYDLTSKPPGTIEFE